MMESKTMTSAEPKPRTNYVLCCWSGARRTPDLRRQIDPSFYLRKHIQSLHKLKHSLDQITIVIPENPTEPEFFREYLRSVPAQIQDTPVVIMERPNVGLSYGSLSDCYARYRTAFDFYFFMEDDYVFKQPEFDRLHLQEMLAHPDCGYLCGLAWTVPHQPLHAGIANGLMRGAALEKIFVADGLIPHARNTDYGAAEVVGQIGQSKAIIAHGYSLRDWSTKYRVVFRQAESSLREFNSECADTMMEPI